MFQLWQPIKKSSLDNEHERNNWSVKQRDFFIVEMKIMFDIQRIALKKKIAVTPMKIVS